VLDNGLSSVAGLCLENLDDDKDDEDAKPDVVPELGAKQADGTMVGSGEGKVQVLFTFGPLNADLRP
jgi:hypothetical protein